VPYQERLSQALMEQYSWMLEASFSLVSVSDFSQRFLEHFTEE
jgi:hypothetical protein